MNCEVTEQELTKNKKLALNYVRRKIRYGEQYDIIIKKAVEKFKVRQEYIKENIKEKK